MEVLGRAELPLPAFERFEFRLEPILGAKIGNGLHVGADLTDGRVDETRNQRVFGEVPGVELHVDDVRDVRPARRARLTRVVGVALDGTSQSFEKGGLARAPRSEQPDGQRRFEIARRKERSEGFDVRTDGQRIVRPGFVEPYDRLGLIAVEIDGPTREQCFLFAQHLAPDLDRLGERRGVGDESLAQIWNVDAEREQLVGGVDAPRHEGAGQMERAHLHAGAGAGEPGARRSRQFPRGFERVEHTRTDVEVGKLGGDV